MDVSVLLSVGSFAVSERVLKPKASVLAILGCVLAYDLTTKTHDVSALRVYRGPAMIAFTLMMAAWSLRTWRRNGVACDELLFLPGTPHGAAVTDQPGGELYNNEGDAAAGPSPRDNITTPMLMDNSHNNNIDASGSNSMEEIELTQTTGSFDEAPPTPAASELRVRLTSVDEEGGASFVDQWDTENNNNNNNSVDADDSSSFGSGLIQRNRSTEDPHQAQQQAPRTNLERFQENHPRITRIGSLFFFRTPDTTTQNATYAPSGPSVFGAGLDMSMPILVNFHLFIEAFNHIETDPMSEFTCKILPLIFLSVLIVRTSVPPGRRKRFWSTMRFTFMAPFHKIRFRDAMIGDILTSLVRPFQDILFALSYYVTVVTGTVLGTKSLAEAGTALEQSWFLHNVVLPSCAILPLWWRFLQSLREAYDNNKRWPYYGDSFKYLSAATIILYGMTHPEGRRSAWWIVSFVMAVLYQIYWDTVMDWELFCIVPRDAVADNNSSGDDNYLCARISSLRPTSRILLTLHMYISQPISEQLRRLIASIPSYSQIQLRSKRLYKTRTFYYRCFVLNAVLRCLWMLCFIPAYRLSEQGHEKVTTFSSDVNSMFGVLLPVAEIVRRAHWGFIKVEMETIRMMSAEEEDDYEYSHVMGGIIDEHHRSNTSEHNNVDDNGEHDDDEIDDQSKHDSRSTMLMMPVWLDAPQAQLHNSASSSPSIVSSIAKCCTAVIAYLKSDRFRRNVFVVELSLWAVAFVGFGYWATY